jgi:general secretion pathway protein G
MNNRLRKRARRRGVTLVEVLIVVSIMAVISGGVVLVAIPEHNKAKIRMAAIGAGAIKEAAEMWREVDTGAEAGACPTVQDLIAARKLDPQKIDDPWGSQYRIRCDYGEIHVASPGHDRKQDTPDDVRNGMKPAELEAIARL